MSWRDIARAAVQAEARACAEPGGDFGENDNFADASADAIAEREAIASIDGGLPQSWATALTAIEHGPRPIGLPERDWRARLDAIWARADEHGPSFVANGWTFDEVFGVGDCWLRLDQRGAAWLASSARIVEVTPERIVYQRGTERSTHHKQGRLH